MCVNTGFLAIFFSNYGFLFLFVVFLLYLYLSLPFSRFCPSLSLSPHLSPLPISFALSLSFPRSPHFALSLSFLFSRPFSLVVSIQGVFALTYDATSPAHSKESTIISAILPRIHLWFVLSLHWLWIGKFHNRASWMVAWHSITNANHLNSPTTLSTGIEDYSNYFFSCNIESNKLTWATHQETNRKKYKNGGLLKIHL